MVLFVSVFDNYVSKDTCFIGDGERKEKKKDNIVIGLFVGYMVIQVYLLR